MAHRLLGSLVSHLRNLTDDSEDATDGSLLERFSNLREEAAFGALVRRHGPMVLGLCRRVLRDDHDAEDAFQATFLILARRAAALDRRRPLSNWLYTVAYHVGLRARAGSARRRAVEEAVVRPTTVAEGPTSLENREAIQVLDEELQRLPDKYRAPLVLCYLQGQTHAEAAQALGLPRGSMAKRLAAAEDRLRQRLLRRGAVGAAGVTWAALGPVVVAAPLIEQTSRAAVHFCEGAASAGTVPVAVRALAEGGLRMMIASKRFWVLSVVVALAVLGPVAAIACGLFRDAPLPESVAAEGQEAKTEAPPVRASVDAKETEEAGWSTVTGRIVFGGANLPAPIAVKMGANGAGCLPAGGQIFGEEWVVDQKTKGVRWVFVWLSPVGGANNPLPIHPSLTEITVKEAVIDQPCCQFVPHALALRQGQDLIVKNSSAIVHNANVSGHPLRNPGKNFAIPAGMSGKLDGLKADEKVAISVACDIHPWMKGYVRVFDHPYFAVTDAEGRFVIPKAPAGNCRLRVWHDSGWLGGAAGKDGQLLMVENGKPTEVGELRLGP